MASTLKVNTIQNAAGSAPFFTDLGMKSKYFAVEINNTSLTENVLTRYNLGTLIGDAGTVSSNQVTIAQAGTYILHFFIACAGIENANSRWQENYLKLTRGGSTTTLLDARDHIINIDTNYEYYHVSASRIHGLQANDIIFIETNGQNTASGGSNGSQFMGIRIE